MHMVPFYNKFMIYELKNTGERVRVDISEEEFTKTNGKTLFHPKEVLVIVNEEIRRIYIWKGINASVRKKFIGSRVASALQKELMENANFHRCKIVSIDQGDELEEFIRNFGLDVKKFEIKSPLKEEIREIESMGSQAYKKSELIYQDSKRTQTPVDNLINRKSKKESKIDEKGINNGIQPILERILDKKLSQKYDRKHIILGKGKLFGKVEKKSEIFGKEIKNVEWEQIENVNRKILELDGFKFRIFFNPEKNLIEAIEVLEKLDFQVEEESKPSFQFDKWTVNNLRGFCKEQNIEIPSGSKKEDIIKLIQEFYE